VRSSDVLADLKAREAADTRTAVAVSQRIGAGTASTGQNSTRFRIAPGYSHQLHAPRIPQAVASRLQLLSPKSGREPG